MHTNDFISTQTQFLQEARKILREKSSTIAPKCIEFYSLFDVRDCCRRILVIKEPSWGYIPNIVHRYCLIHELSLPDLKKPSILHLDKEIKSVKIVQTVSSDRLTM